MVCGVRPLIALSSRFADEAATWRVPVSAVGVTYQHAIVRAGGQPVAHLRGAPGKAPHVRVQAVILALGAVVCMVLLLTGLPQGPSQLFQVAAERRYDALPG